MTWCHEKKIWGTSNYSCLLWDMQQGDVVPLANFQQDPLHNLSHLFFLAHMISLIRSSYAHVSLCNLCWKNVKKIRIFGTVCHSLLLFIRRPQSRADQLKAGSSSSIRHPRFTTSRVGRVCWHVYIWNETKCIQLAMFQICSLRILKSTETQLHHIVIWGRIYLWLVLLFLWGMPTGRSLFFFPVTQWFLGFFKKQCRKEKKTLLLEHTWCWH